MVQKINWIGLFFIIEIIIILGIIMLNVPQTINQINNLNADNLYGKWASYFICCVLFLLITYNIKLIKEEN